MSIDLSNYNDVASRIQEFREKYPDGSLRPADVAFPYRIEQIGDQVYIAVVAAAYRNPEDPAPGVGMAYEPVPGSTRYTRGSELQNAETSAWGRAIVAVLAADTRRGVSSAEEVRNRRAEDVEESEVDTLRRDIKDVAVEKGIDLDRIVADFHSRTKVDIREAEPNLLKHYLGHLRTHGLVVKEES